MQGLNPPTGRTDPTRGESCVRIRRRDGPHGACIAMGLHSLRKFSTLGRLGSRLSASVASPFGLVPGIGFPIGVDFGVGSLKLLQLEEGNPPSLIAAARVDTPEHLLNDPERRLMFQFEALAKIVKQGGFKGKRAACAIPAWATSYKPLQINRVEGQSLASQVEAAISVQLGQDPATLVYRSIETGVGTPARADVLVLSVTRELVDRLMGAIVGAKLVPVGMHGEYAATLRAFEPVLKHAADPTQATLFLDVGAGSTNLMIAQGTKLVFARRIDIGGRHLDEAVASQLGVSRAEALAMRTRVDAPQPVATGAAASGFGTDLSAEQSEVGPSSADLSEPLEILTDEILLSLRHHGAQSPGQSVRRVVFIGGEARRKGLCRHIAHVLRLPAQIADPMAAIVRTGSEPCTGVDLRQSQPGWTVPLGVCLSPTDL